jgi:acetyl esterase/lipase
MKAKIILSMLTYLSTGFSILPFLKPNNRERAAMLWLPKLLAGALSSVFLLFATIGTIYGRLRRKRFLRLSGLLGMGLSLTLIAHVTRRHEGFTEAFGEDWQERIPPEMRARLQPRRWMGISIPPQDYSLQKDITYAHNEHSGAPLLADLWLPPVGVSSTGLGIIYVHGGAWRYGTKDMGTRPFFKHLVNQGHTILDIEYTLWPQGDIPNMVREVKRAIRWFKEHANIHGVDPQRIVLMGGSAGAHLVLLASYANKHPAFQLENDPGDTSVRGVVAFYAPTDFRDMKIPNEGTEKRHGILHSQTPLTELIISFSSKRRHEEDIENLSQAHMLAEGQSFFVRMFGGTPEEIPEIYELYSPTSHVSSDCPPTLLLQGSDDIFQLAPGVRCLHQSLQHAGVPSILVEFPHSEHAFDLIFPQINPASQAALQDVERFLAMMCTGDE